MANEDLLKDTSVISEDGKFFTLTITDLAPNISYPIQLRWKNKDGSFSKWSAVKRLPSISDIQPSAIPSVPTVKPVLGAIELAWNGKTATGENQPGGFNSAKVYIGTTENFVPVDSGSPNSNQVDILNFANGQNTINIGVETVVNSSLTIEYEKDYYVKIKTTNGIVAQDSAAVAATGNPVRVGKVSSNGIVEITADKISTGTLKAGSTITVGNSLGKHVTIAGTGDPLKIYGSGGTEILGFDSNGNLKITGTINANAGSFGKDGSTMKIGYSVNTIDSVTYDGIYMGANNYWYNDGKLSVGDGTNGLVWNGEVLSVTGTVNAKGGYFGGASNYWSITNKGIMATGSAEIKIGNYSVKSVDTTDFTVAENIINPTTGAVTYENIIRTESKAGATDSPLRVYLGSVNRQVEVAKSAQISGDGTTANDGTTELAINAYRSGGLRNMFTKSETFSKDLYPSALSGDMLLIYDTAVL